MDGKKDCDTDIILEDDDAINYCENISKCIALSQELKQKLDLYPDVIEYIEKLKRIIYKQMKKIMKWKTKVKELSKVKEKLQDIAIQTDCDLPIKNIKTEEDNKNDKERSLTEEIREAAEEAVHSSGFVYEETSGLYYDYNSGYYYNAEYGLYYDGNSGTYLKYNQDTESYEFHSQVSAVQTSLIKDTDKASKRKSKTTETSKETKRKRRKESDSEDVEEGECSESESSSEDETSNSETSDICKQWPPCMRLIVESTEIPTMKTGSLYIITCDGGTIGREGDHSIRLSDVNVSKHHLKIHYNAESSKYLITDLGSRNGTYLNSKRLSTSKQESEPAEITHGSKLQLGSTTLVCHIHEGNQTCGHCEPGLLIEEKKDPPVRKNKINMNEEYKKELRKLKKQHGFLGDNDEAKLAHGYTDRAQKRRETVGSQNPFEKTQAASVDESISSENKGFKLLSKMGWKEGQPLGKDSTSGTLEPIKVISNVGTSGIGSTPHNVLEISNSDTKNSIWKKTQERFNLLPNKKIFGEDDETEDVS